MYLWTLATIEMSLKIILGEGSSRLYNVRNDAFELLFELAECAGDVSELAKRIMWFSVSKICSTPKKGLNPTRQMDSDTEGHA